MSAQQQRGPTRNAPASAANTGGANQDRRVVNAVGFGNQAAQNDMVDMSNPAMIEAVHDANELGVATQINDLGAPQPFTQLDRMVDQSVPHARTEEAVTVVEEALGYDLAENVVIHLDRYAAVVAGTYNAEAVQIEEHVYVHRQIEEQIVDRLYPPALFDNAGPDTGGEEALSEPDKRPPWAKHEDSEIVVTPGNYTIECRGAEVIIYDRNEDVVTRIWGDPHVDEGGKGGDDWHFGQDSTFVLPDGTKICLDTEPNEHGWWFVVGVDVLFGYTRWHYGTGDTNGMHHDAEEWDAAHADASEDKSAGLFFLQSNGEWAKMNPDGSVTDVANESWKDYQATGDVTTGPAEAVGLTHAQWEALDQADQVRILKKYGQYDQTRSQA